MKTLRYFLINGFFAYSIYAGLVLKQGGFLNIALFMGWFTSVSSFALLNKEVKQKAKKDLLNQTVPTYFDVTFDLCVSASFVYFGYIWLPIFYVIHMGNVIGARNDLKEETG